MSYADYKKRQTEADTNKSASSSLSGYAQYKANKNNEPLQTNNIKSEISNNFVNYNPDNISQMFANQPATRYPSSLQQAAVDKVTNNIQPLNTNVPDIGGIKISNADEKIQNINEQDLGSNKVSRFFNRALNAIQGGATQWVAGQESGMAATYGLGQDYRTAENQALRDQAQSDFDRYTRAYEEELAAGTAQEGDEYYTNLINDAKRRLDAYNTVVEGNVQQKATRATEALADDTAKVGQARIEKAEEGLGTAGRMAVEALASTTQSTLDAAVNLATGTQTMIPFAFRAFGGGVQDARQKGYDEKRALYEGIKGMANEIFWEKAFGLNPLQKAAYGSGSWDEILEHAVNVAVDKLKDSPLGEELAEKMLSLGADFLSEGLEEFGGTWTDWIMRNIESGVFNMEQAEDIESFWDTAKQSVYDGIVGGLSGIFGGVSGNVISSGVNTVNNELKGASVNYNMDPTASSSAYQTMIEEGRNIDSKYADSALKQLADKGKVSNYTIGGLANDIENYTDFDIEADGLLRKASQDLNENGKLKIGMLNDIYENKAAMDRLGIESPTRDSIETALKQFANEFNESNTTQQENIRPEIKTPRTFDFKPVSEKVQRDSEAYKEKVTTQVDALVEGLGENGKELFKEIDKGPVEQGKLFNAFRLVYDAGIRNDVEYTPSGEYANILSPEQFKRAWNAGRMDNIKDVSSQVKKYKKVVKSLDGKIRDINGKTDDSPIIQKFLADEVNGKRNRAIFEYYSNEAKKYGVDIVFTEHDENKKNAGAIQVGQGVIEVEIDSPNIMDGILKHELTHRFQELAPKEYNELKRLFLQYLDSNYYENATRILTERYRTEVGQKLSRSEVSDELLADFAYQIWGDQKLQQELAEVDLNGFRKLISIFEKILNKIKSLFNLSKKELSQYEQLVAQMEKTQKAAEKKARELKASGNVSDAVFRNALKNSDLNLIATHATHEAKLMQALNMEGLPGLSIAVIDIDSGLANEGYGEISLVFNKSTIDPAREGNKVYGADIWSPTSHNARIEREFDRKAVNAFDRRIAELARKIPGTDVSTSVLSGIFYSSDDSTTETIDDLAIRFQSNPTVKSAYLADKGVDITPEYRTKEYHHLGNEFLDFILDRYNDYGTIIIELVDMFARAYEYKLTDADKNTIADLVKEHHLKAGKEERLASLLSNAYRIGDRADSNDLKLLQAVLNYDEDGRPKVNEIDKLATYNKIDEAVRNDSEAFNNWIVKQLNDANIFTGNEGIYDGKDAVTDNGRRTFKQLHLPVTAANIVKMMSKEEERGVGYYGHGAEGMQALTAKSYESIEDIRNDRDRLKFVPEEEYQEMIDDIDDKTNELILDIADFNNEPGNSFAMNDPFMDAVKSTRTLPAIKKAFSAYGYKISDSLAKRLQDICNEAAVLPSKYFEAKATRVVRFNEIVEAIIPDNSSPALIEALQKKNIPFDTYTAGDNSQRLSMIQEMDGVRFALKDSQGNELSQGQVEFFKDSKIRDKNGKLMVMHHGTSRADRVGYYFNPDRATSGPMAYFTNSAEIAKNYSEQKKDTSLSRDYETEFDMYSVDGKNLDDLWNSLSKSAKNKVLNDINNIGLETDDFEYWVKEDNANANAFGKNTIQFYIRDEGRNPLWALYRLAEDNGAESTFSEALNLLFEGSNVEFDNPESTVNKVYDVYLNVTNPLDTSNIPSNIIDGLREESKKAQKSFNPEGNRLSDTYDKKNVSPDWWLSRFEDDVKNHTTYSWTTIPDYVTDYLKSKGYDGIVDEGGKQGGATHIVVIPFYSNQIKNIDNLNPTKDKDIRYKLRESDLVGHLEKFTELSDFMSEYVNKRATIKLNKQEYARLSRAVFRRNSMHLNDGTHTVISSYTSDNYYLCETWGDNEFRPIFKKSIIGNEDYIKGVEDAINRIARTLDTEDVRTEDGNGRYNNGYVDSEYRRSGEENAKLDRRESRLPEDRNNDNGNGIQSGKRLALKDGVYESTDGKTATFTEERLNSEIEDNYYGKTKDGERTRAYIAFINPKDFVRATTIDYDSFVERETNKGTIKELDTEKLRGNRQTPFLKVEFISDTAARIVGHEGRHRMVALANAGYERVAIILDDYERRYETGKRTINGMYLEGQDFYGEKGQSILLEKATPLFKGNIDFIKKTYGENAGLRYALKNDGTQISFEDLQKMAEEGEQISFDDLARINFESVQTEPEKTGKEKLLNIIDATIDDMHKEGKNTWSAGRILDFYTKNPEMDFVRRIAEKDANAKAELVAMLSTIDDIKLVDKISWYGFGAHWETRYNKSLKNAQRVARNLAKARMSEIAKVKSPEYPSVTEKHYTITELRTMFDAVNANDELKALADKVFPVAEKLGVQIMFNNQLLGRRSAGGVAYGRFAQYKLNSWNDPQHTNQWRSEIIVHELIHVCTSYAMDAYDNHKDHKLTMEQEKALIAIENVYKQVKADKDFKGMYGTKNTHEMLAELSNFEFRTKLQQKSLLEKIYNAIKEFFGIKKTDTLYNVLDNALDVLLDSADTGNQAYIDYHKQALAYARSNGYKYALKGEQDVFALADKNAKTQERLKELSKVKRQLNEERKKNAKLARELTLTTQAEPRMEDVNRVARQILDKYDSSLSFEELRSQIYEATMLVMSDEPNWDEINYVLHHAAVNVLENCFVDTSDEQSRRLSDLLRTTGLKLDEKAKAELKKMYDKGDYFGKLLIKNDGRSIDDFWEDYKDDFRGYWATDKDLDNLATGDIISILVDTANAIRNTAEPAFTSYEIGEYSTLMADDLLNTLISEEVRQMPETYADKMTQAVERAKYKGAEAVSRVRETKNAQLEKQKADYEHRIEKLRLKMNKKVTELQEKNRADKEKILKENKKRLSKKELKKRITEHTNKLSQELLNPSNDKHIPESMKDAVTKMLYLINQESTFDYDIDRKRVDKGEGIVTKRTRAFRELRLEYEKMLRNSENEMTVDPDLMYLIDELIELKDTPLNAMSVDQLTTVWNIIRAVEASISSINKLFGAIKYASVQGWAQDIYNENIGKKERRNRANRVEDTVDRIFTTDNLTPQAFFHRFGASGEEIFKMLRKAQDAQTTLIDKARASTEEILKGVKVNDLDKEMHEFKIRNSTITLSTSQIMYLYKLAQRPQAQEHIFLGGIKPEVAKQNKGWANTQARPTQVGLEDITKIVNTLTDEQKKIADALQKYWADGELSEAGNQASMEVYNYEKFTDPNYVRIFVDANTLNTNDSELTKFATASVSGKGMAKSVKPHAKNALILKSIFDVHAEYVNDMSTYSAWLGALENARRVMNFKFENSDNMGNLINQIIGAHGKGYWNDLLGDLNRGRSLQENTAGWEKLSSNYKASAVAANLRVIIQQPTAIFRALAEIDGKYLTAGIVQPGDWEKVKKYSPIAVWKDWGNFDINTGRQMRDVILGSDSVKDAIIQKLMEGAGKADSFTWARIWNAVELETQDLHKELEVGSEEYYKFVAERYGEIIDKTQVVDGILQRSGAMRSKDGIKKMSASFMAEPTKTWNMLLSAIYDYNQGNKSQLAKSVKAIVVSFVVNALAQSIIDAMRDKDQDQDYWEKFLEAFIGISGDEEKFLDYWNNMWSSNFLDNFNPLGYAPFFKDIKSILQGFTVERMDMQAINGLVNAAKSTMKAMSGSGTKTVANSIIALTAEAGRVFGLPVASVRKDIEGLLQTTLQATHSYVMLYKVQKFLMNINSNSARSGFYNILYDAYKNDKQAYNIIRQDMIRSGVKSESIENAIKNRKKKDK